VIFDLDGTITRSDTLIPFVAGCLARFPRLRVNMFLLPLDMVRFGLGFISAGTMKERLLSAVIGGLPVEDVNRWAETFASHVVSARCHASILQLLKDHQTQGDRVILLSASPSLYVRFIGQALGISEIVATEIEVKNGCYTGTLLTPNCAGHEKLRRIREHLGADKYAGKTLAFGDRESDRPLLEWADEGWFVRGAHRRRATLAATPAHSVGNAANIPSILPFL
jgi:phosphatidylglycerophosphatase C